MRITDCHAHIFPAKIAEKATEGIGRFYDKEMRYLGSPDVLLESGRKAGVTRFWVHSVATTPHQVSSINHFIAEQCAAHPEFVGFGTLHPGSDDIERDVNELIGLGLRGVKIHPDFQRFNIDDDSAVEMYRLFAGKLPILVHLGDDRYDFSHPRRMAHALDLVPDLVCVGAHMGGYRVWEEGFEYLGGKNCWVDTSSTLGMMNDYDRARALVKRFGTDRMIFGVDFPMWDHAEELERFSRLGIRGDALEKVLWRNAETALTEKPF